jgi:hypothetical protein
MAFEKLKRYKSSGFDQIPAELITAWCRTIRSEIHKLMKSIWNKEELPESCGRIRSLYLFIRRAMKEIIVVNRGILPVPNTYKILSSILLSRLIPYAGEIIWDHHCGFRHNRSITDHIFCIRQIRGYSK